VRWPSHAISYGRNLLVSEEQVIAARPTDNPEAYDAYLRGLAYTRKRETLPPTTLAHRDISKKRAGGPQVALSFGALLSYVDALGYLTLTFNQRSPSAKRCVRQLKKRSLFSPTREAIVARDITTTPA